MRALGLQATVAGGLGKILGAGVKAGAKFQEKLPSKAAKTVSLVGKDGVKSNIRTECVNHLDSLNSQQSFSKTWPP